MGALAVLLLATFAFGASLHVSRTVFERLPHLEDEFAYLFQAKVFASGQIWAPRDPAWQEVKFFWQPFVIQPDTADPVDGVYKRFGKYTPGWPILLALGALVNAPWIVNAWIAALSVVLIYRLGRGVFSEAVGVVAALLLAISPMALLLNATLMSHTSALFFTLLFVYGYWRTTRTRAGWRGLLIWGAVAGLALGWIVATRPLTAVAIAFPVGLHALARFMESFNTKPLTHGVGRVVVPLVALGIGVLPAAALYPAFNYAVTGSAGTNLYQLLWDYDQIGFGPNHGLMPGGHTLEFGWRNARSDLEIWLRDLYGWTLDPGLAQYATDNLGWGAGVGLSGLVVVIGLIAGRKNEWIWLLFELMIAIVLAQLTYWIGSSVDNSAVYSIRYYYEATGGIILVSAYGLVALARSWRDKTALVVHAPPGFVDRFRLAWRTVWPGYFLIMVAAGVSLLGYTPARFAETIHTYAGDWVNGLYRFNTVGQQELDALNAVRVPGKPVLVLIFNHPDGTPDDWRDYGALMAETSPFLDSDIVLARVYSADSADEVIRHFPGRQVLYEVGQKLFTTRDEALKGGSAEQPNPAADATNPF